MDVRDSGLVRDATPDRAPLVLPLLLTEAQREPILLKGEIPSPVNPPSGCRFHTRCAIAQFPICSDEEPPLEEKVSGHRAACHFAGQL